MNYPIYLSFSTCCAQSGNKNKHLGAQLVTAGEKWNSDKNCNKTQQLSHTLF